MACLGLPVCLEHRGGVAYSAPLYSRPPFGSGFNWYVYGADGGVKVAEERRAETVTVVPPAPIWIWTGPPTLRRSAVRGVTMPANCGAPVAVPTLTHDGRSARTVSS